MIRIRTLGENTIEVGGARIGPESAVLFGLLLFLASQRGRPVSRIRVRELLWPGVSENKAWHSLRQLLYRVRRLGVEVEASADHLALRASDVEADFLLVADAAVAGVGAARIEGVRGPFLGAYNPRFSRPFLAWLDEQRSIVHARLRSALLADLSFHRKRGSWPVVEHLAREVLAVDPLNEEATLSLAEATALAGSKAEAVALLDRYVADLGDARDSRLALSPAVLRRRIAERLPEPACSRGLEPAFVGRGDSVAFLNGVLQRAGAGAGECCHLWGAAGIGKTRLLDEFRRSAGLAGARVERTACQPGDSQRPLSVFAALVPRLLGLPGALGCAPESLEFLRRLVSHDTSAVTLSPETAEAAHLAANIRRAIYDLLDAVAMEGTLVVIVEDIHWADAQSRTLIDELAAWVATRPAAIVCSSRERTGTGAGSLRVHAVGPLSPGETLALVKSLDPSCAVDAVASDRCVRISQGNPLYAKTLLEFWQLTGDTGSVPPTLSALFSNRLAGLPDESLLALQAIAVLGRNATANRLAGVLQFRSYQLVQVLDTLAAEGLIADSGNQLACAHELIACAAVDRLTGIARRSLHRLTAEQLEKDKSNPVDAAMLWDCADHWRQAGESEHAVRFALDCSRHLLELGLPHEAAELLERARVSCDDANTRQELLAALAFAYQQSARWADVVEVLREKWRRTSIDHRLSSEKADEELMFLEASLRAEVGEIRELGQRAAVLAGTNITPNHRVRAASLCLIIHSECCDEAAASEVYATTVAAREDDQVDPLLAYEVEVLYQTSFGDVLSGAFAADRLVELARTASSPQGLARALRFAGTSFRMAGRLNDAEAVMVEAIEVGKRHRLATAVAQATSKMAVVRLAANDFVGALEWSKRAKALIPSNVTHIHALEQVVTVVQAHLGLGDLEHALREYQTVRDCSIPCELMRAVTEFAALRMRMAIELGRVVPQSEVESLRLSHLRMRDKGVQDFAVASLLRGMASCGQARAARELYAEYVGLFRRDRTPLSNDLIAINAALNATA